MCFLFIDIHTSVIFSLHALIYVALHDHVMALFCQVKEGKLLEDVSTQVSNLATKVMKYCSVSDLTVSNLQTQLKSPDSNISYYKSLIEIIISCLSKYICTCFSGVKEISYGGHFLSR